MLSTNCSLAIVFILRCRQILINLKMWRDMFSSTQLYNAKAFMLPIVLFSVLLLCCVIKDVIFSQTLVSFPAQFLRECSFYPPPTEKLQGTAIKVSTSTTYWNSFPARSLGKMLTIDSIFVYCNQSCMCMSKAFCCPYADKLIVDKKSMLFFLVIMDILSFV